MYPKIQYSVKSLVLSIPLFCVNLYSGQEKDSLKVKDSAISKKVAMAVTDRFPMARLINIEYTNSLPYTISSNYLGKDMGESKVNQLSQAKVSSTINLIRKKKWALSTTLNYNYISVNVDGTNFFNNSILNDHTIDFHYHTTSLTGTYYSKLFNKTVIYSGTATVDGSEKNFERVRGLVTATMVLKANAKTKMTVGIIGLIDPNAIVPSFLTFSYEHKFNNGLIIDAILPKWVYLRKNLKDYGRLSLGTELGGTMFYLYNNDRAFTFSQMDINSGVMYEHRLGNSFIASLKSGIRYSPTSRLLDKQANFKDFTLDSKPDPTFYFNIGISYNPFKNKK
ncbi:DUF6268 family outer membrane beta-barrel protein [Chryseobacterium sp. Ch-15]|uniref:DUF6268 family outer membrane beta-barrel protein n=1 Tax=Chryseobacterium muglaense TaxID=2893752 RepID=A0A9Q3UPY1_9FLAO|nr:DUF6268 family outer membrane beta-barrel protein [Chryseobacterium muglaense]MBD3906089.1 hypothetical protein [Chryseobacterium muglaense]MCC9032974.1 DUF6268 family outer membrane beta-barrel protein [Chryseobacterium muglaense]MCM2556554.1 DUF6268 family outer membrane beta-barrel protein [Chryseobacterium muglaense]